MSGSIEYLIFSSFITRISRFFSFGVMNLVDRIIFLKCYNEIMPSLTSSTSSKRYFKILYVFWISSQ